jgi:hypothetical protein
VRLTLQFTGLPSCCALRQPVTLHVGWHRPKEYAGFIEHGSLHYFPLRRQSGCGGYACSQRAVPRIGHWSFRDAPSNIPIERTRWRAPLIATLGRSSPPAMHTKSVSSAIIGSFPERGFIEALVTLQSRPSLRVCVEVPDFELLEVRLAVADALLPNLLEGLHAVEHLVNTAHPERSPAQVWEIWVKAGGTASYSCGCNDAEEEEFTTVVRSASGSLRFEA